MEVEILDATRKGTGGFSLVELLITLAVAAILLTLAVPSFQDYMANQRVRSASADLVSALNLARSEAVKRAADVSVVPTAGWANGWVVKVGAIELRKYSRVEGVAITASAAAPTYGRDGRIGSGAAVDFLVAPIGTSSASPRCVRVALSGKATSSVGGCS